MARGREDCIVLLPFLAQGHIIPFLALATQLHERTSYNIIIANTPLNIKKIRPSLPANSSITLVELPFCGTDHGLPPYSESTDVLPYDIIIRLFQASLTLKPSFNQLISDITTQQGHPPLCIVTDMLLSWTVDVANHFNIFHATLLTSGAYSMAIYYSLWMHLPHCKTSSPDFPVPEFPQVSTLNRSQLARDLKNGSDSDARTVYNRSQLGLWWRSDGLLISTFEELDPTGLEFFRRKMGGRPVWPIVPTLYSSSNVRPQTKSGIELEHCLDWLDNHPADSVIFVCFGSQNTLSTSQLMELAIGLEKSEKNFIWVIRPPLGFDINGELRSEWLPEGFEKRIKQDNRGLLVHKWAPQVEILAHKSTGAFLSHCGWNSTLESLKHGVPIIGWPLAGEQFYNSKLLEEEVGVCIEVARGNSVTCDIKREEIVRVIDLVMGETQKGEEMKKKVSEIKEMIQNAIRDEEGFKGSSVQAIDNFIATVSKMKL